MNRLSMRERINRYFDRRLLRMDELLRAKADKRGYTRVKMIPKELYYNGLIAKHNEALRYKPREPGMPLLPNLEPFENGY